MSDGGTPPAAAGVNAEQAAEGLRALGAAWGAGGYRFGFDPDRGWWAIRDGRTGFLLTAASPGELSGMLAARAGAGR